MSETTLKPCAHCGSDKLLEGYENRCCSAYISCLDCYTRTGYFMTHAEAAEIWNRRTTPEHTDSDFSTVLTQLKEMLTLTPEIEEQLNYVWNTHKAGYTDIEFQLHEEMKKNLAGGWVDVNEQPPEIGHLVLIHTPYGNLEVAEYRGFSEFMKAHKFIQNANKHYLRVMIGTHWMPLPEPPGTEANDDEK